MRWLILSAASGLIAINAAASCGKADEPYQTEWSAQLGSIDDDYSTSVAVDSNGTAYVTGYTRTSGKRVGTTQRDVDAWLVKIDPRGRQLWRKPIRSIGRSVTVDASGAAFVAGDTKGDLAGTNQGRTDAWIAKFAPNGNLLWNIQPGTSGDDSIRSVAVDSTGAVYVAGRTLGDISGPSYRYVWVAKYDSGGAELWKTKLGSSAADKASRFPVFPSCNSIAVDSAGAVHLTGYTTGDFAGKSLGEDDAWLAKLNPKGKVLWKTQFGTSSEEDSTSVAVDSSGAIYVTGYSEGPFAGPFNGGNWDAWLAKFDSSGAQLWKTQFGTKRDERSYAVAVDSTGRVFVAGETSGDLAGALKGGRDAWLAKFDSTGAELWRTQLGSDSVDVGRSIAVGKDNAVYMTGDTSGDLGGGNLGGRDGFLIKLSPQD